MFLYILERWYIGRKGARGGEGTKKIVCLKFLNIVIFFKKKGSVCAYLKLWGRDSLNFWVAPFFF